MSLFSRKVILAIEIIRKESEFLGMGVFDLLRDIRKNSRMIYSAKVCEAEYVLRQDGAYYPGE